jgi:hypothetical protein
MNETFTGLGTFTLYAPVAAYFNIQGKLTLPTIGEGAIANSAVVVTINKNGASAFYTGSAGAEGFATAVSCAQGDAINIILSSSAPVDQGLNVIKLTVSMF